MKLAFVIPWYGEILGGAENECRKTAEHLLSKEVEVEVLTTCVNDLYSDWGKNYYDEGDYSLNGVKIKRFPVRKRNSKAFDEVNYKLMYNQKISREEEEVYIREMINSDKLYNYIKNNEGKYDFFIFIPYMFGTTYYGLQIHPQKSILIPCLHDESYAHLNIYKPVFEKIRGMVFYSNSERELAERIFDLSSVKSKVIGAGVDTRLDFKATRFLRKYKITKPFILYAGRKETGKNVPLLIEFFSEYKKRNKNKLKLVLIGPGKIQISKEKDCGIIDLEFVPTKDKYDAYSAALLLCQPSINESFSLAIMESWVCSRPVLVNEKCAPTKEFCIKSNGGLWFSNYNEFESCINLVLKNPHLAKKLGLNGRSYVLKNFKWNKITENLIRYLENLKE
jgi:glycosyltransferase involved in cell wall biosynthesis